MTNVQDRQLSVDERPLKYQTIGSLLKNRAEEYPDDVFLVDGRSDTNLTYHEVNKKANQIANGLQRFGVDPLDRVATLHSDPLTTSLLMFGVAKRGGSIFPRQP